MPGSERGPSGKLRNYIVYVHLTYHTLPPHTRARWLSEPGLLAGWPATRPCTAGLALVI